LTQSEPINTAALVEEAEDSKDKEVYRLLQKDPIYRIGVGARANPPDASSFFIEIVINLSDESGEVNLPRLDRVIRCLKILQKRGYTLTYEDGNCISCETKKAIKNPNEEYLTVKSFMKTAFIK
jgi:hypothetical protein